jgi:hypothetical protein
VNKGDQLPDVVIGFSGEANDDIELDVQDVVLDESVAGGQDLFLVDPLPDQVSQPL